MIIDELDRISEEAFDEVSQRMRLVHKFSKGLLNLNPVPETHWIYRKFIKDGYPQTKVIKSSSYDNFIKVKLPVSSLKKKLSRIITMIKNTLSLTISVMKSLEKRGIFI